MRNLESGICDAQRKVAELIRDKAGAWKEFDQQILSDLAKFLEDRGVAKEHINKQIDFLELPGVDSDAEESKADVGSTPKEAGGGNIGCVRPCSLRP